MSISHTQYTYNLFLPQLFSFFLAGSMLSGSAGGRSSHEKGLANPDKGRIEVANFPLCFTLLSGPGYEDGHHGNKSLLIKADRFLRMISSS